MQIEKNKMKINNKRSVISGEMVMMIPQLIFLIAVLFAFVFLVKILIVTEVDIRRADAIILVDRILFSRNGISYYDEGIGRLYPGIINLDRFMDISMENPNVLDDSVISYGSDNPLIAAKLNLTQEGKEDIIAFYNKKWYDRWEPKVLLSVTGGSASIESFDKTRNVLIKDGDTLSPGTLSFNILS